MKTKHPFVHRWLLATWFLLVLACGFQSARAYYDPTAGHFLSADPLGHAASMDLHSFCNGDPINRFDPTGRFGKGALDGALAGYGDGLDFGSEGPSLGTLTHANRSWASYIGYGVGWAFGEAEKQIDLAALMAGAGRLVTAGFELGAEGIVLREGELGGMASWAQRSESWATALGENVGARTAIKVNITIALEAGSMNLGTASSLAAEAGMRDRVLANIAESQAARVASKFPTVGVQNATLLDITGRASAITDRLIANDSTYWARVFNNPALRGQRFLAAFNSNPNLARSLIRGNIVDDVSKQLAAKANLPFLKITPRGAYGPDFVNQFLGSSWDVTTPGSWASHAAKYGSEFGDLMPLLY